MITFMKDGRIKIIDPSSSLIDLLLEDGWTEKVEPKEEKPKKAKPKKKASKK